jgi:hypothetical protein
MDSIFIVISAESLSAAKTVVHDAVVSAGFSESNYNFLVGDLQTGTANGITIYTSSRLELVAPGKYLMEIDRNINSDCGDAIKSICSNDSSLEVVSRTRFFEILDGD